MRSRNAASKTAINVLRRTSLPCHNKRALTDMANSTRRHQTTTGLKQQMRNIQKERTKQHFRVIMLMFGRQYISGAMCLVKLFVANIKS